MSKNRPATPDMAVLLSFFAVSCEIAPERIYCILLKYILQKERG